MCCLLYTSPDGRLLFWVRNNTANTGVDVISLAKPSERVHLLNTDTAALYAPGNDGKGYLVWQRDGTLVAQEFDPDTLKVAGEIRTLSNHVATSEIIGQMMATVSGNGLLLYSSADTASQLTWFDPSGKRLGTLGDPGDYEDLRLSPDGRSVAASRDKPGGSDIWLLDTERGLSSRFTSRFGTNAFPIWSPDGRTIVFRSRLNIFRKDVTGTGEEEQVAGSTSLQNPADWSRDGKSILYQDIAPTTGLDLWVLPVTPDGKPAGASRPYLLSLIHICDEGTVDSVHPNWSNQLSNRTASLCWRFTMSAKALRALTTLSENIQRNSAQIEDRLRKAGVTPDAALVYSAAKYFEALNKLASE